MCIYMYDIYDVQLPFHSRYFLYMAFCFRMTATSVKKLDTHIYIYVCVCVRARVYMYKTSNRKPSTFSFSKSY